MSDRLLKESDVMKAIDERIKELSSDSAFIRKNGHIDVWGVKKHILAIPSADRPQKVIAQVTFDEEKLREIVKEAVERFKEEYEITNRPQGEWERIPYSFAGGYRCSICGQKSLENHLNYCSNCGAYMKGANDER